METETRNEPARKVPFLAAAGKPCSSPKSERPWGALDLPGVRAGAACLTAVLPGRSGTISFNPLPFASLALPLALPAHIRILQGLLPRPSTPLSQRKLKTPLEKDENNLILPKIAYYKRKEWGGG